MYTHVTKRKIKKHWYEGGEEVPNEKTRRVTKRREKVVEYFMLRRKMCTTTIQLNLKGIEKYRDFSHIYSKEQA
jgi:hypothetical protein